MDCYTWVLLACMAATAAAWSAPIHPSHVHRAPMRFTRFAPPPHRHVPVRHHQPVFIEPEEPKRDRPKREHYDYDDHEKPTSGVTGPVHTFVKTDKNANYKWGVRHHVGNKYAS